MRLYVSLLLLTLVACAEGRLQDADMSTDTGPSGSLGRCGDGKIEAPEVCDDGNGVNEDGCSSNCAIEFGWTCDTSTPSVCQQMSKCGNAALDPGETCDGLNLNGGTCGTQGFAQGLLQCDSQCNYDVSMCTNDLCGNNKTDAGEDCDDGNMTPNDGCTGCSIDPGWMCTGTPSTCTKPCGNGQVEAGEECDGISFAGKTCSTYGGVSGQLACTDTCTVDAAGCVIPNCDNGLLEMSEDCDGDNLQGQNCESLGQGFIGGTLGCDAACRYDTSACLSPRCGDDMIQNNERCDGTDLGGETCQSRGFDFGDLACNTGCRFDERACGSATCGNGQLEGNEPCDTMNFNNQTCSDFGFTNGALACTNCASVDSSGCYDCGPVQGCMENNSGTANTCPDPLIVGRQDALAGILYTGNSSTFTLDDDNITGCFDSAEDVFFRIYLESGERLSLNLNPVTVGFDAVLKVYEGTDCGRNGLSDLLVCQDAEISMAESFAFNAATTGWHTVVVDGAFGGDSGSFEMAFLLTCNRPDCCCN